MRNRVRTWAGSYLGTLKFMCKLWEWMLGLRSGSELARVCQQHMNVTGHHHIADIWCVETDIDEYTQVVFDWTTFGTCRKHATTINSANSYSMSSGPSCIISINTCVQKIEKMCKWQPSDLLSEHISSIESFVSRSYGNLIIGRWNLLIFEDKNNQYIVGKHILRCPR